LAFLLNLAGIKFGGSTNERKEIAGIMN